MKTLPFPHADFPVTTPRITRPAASVGPTFAPLANRIAFASSSVLIALEELLASRVTCSPASIRAALPTDTIHDALAAAILVAHFPFGAPRRASPTTAISSAFPSLTVRNTPALAVVGTSLPYVAAGRTKAAATIRSAFSAFAVRVAGVSVAIYISVSVAVTIAIDIAVSIAVSITVGTVGQALQSNRVITVVAVAAGLVPEHAAVPVPRAIDANAWIVWQTSESVSVIALVA